MLPRTIRTEQVTWFAAERDIRLFYELLVFYAANNTNRRVTWLEVDTSLGLLLKLAGYKEPCQAIWRGRKRIVCIVLDTLGALDERDDYLEGIALLPCPMQLTLESLALTLATITGIQVGMDDLLCDARGREELEDWLTELRRTARQQNHPRAMASAAS